MINMNQGTHLDNFNYGRIMNKLEDNWWIRDVANEFRSTKCVTGQLWKRVYGTGTVQNLIN